MSENPNTQAIVIKLREDFAIHCQRVEGFMEQTNKLIKAHSDEIWGFDEENIGLKSKMKEVNDERRRERESRIWWRGLVGVPVFGLAIDWFVKMFHNLPKP